MNVEHVPGKCPHPARGGRHEEYLQSDGSAECRACGANSRGRGPAKRKCCLSYCWEDHWDTCISKTQTVCPTCDGAEQVMLDTYGKSKMIPCPDCCHADRSGGHPAQPMTDARLKEIENDRRGFFVRSAVRKEVLAEIYRLRHVEKVLRVQIDTLLEGRNVNVSVEGDLTITGPVKQKDITLAAALKQIEELQETVAEKMKIANEFIAKWGGRFRAFEEFEEAADVEDGNAWDAAFADLEAECRRFGIKIVHPDVEIRNQVAPAEPTEKCRCGMVLELACRRCDGGGS